MKTDQETQHILRVRAMIALSEHGHIPLSLNDGEEATPELLYSESHAQSQKRMRLVSQRFGVWIAEDKKKARAALKQEKARTKR